MVLDAMITAQDACWDKGLTPPGAEGAVQKVVLSVSLGRQRVAWPKETALPHQDRASFWLIPINAGG